MNTRFFFIAILFATFTSISYAQNSLGFDFQGYARDPSGAAISLSDGEKLQLKFIITQENNTTEVYSELHEDVEVDPFGVFAVEVGTGGTGVTVQTGNWDNILWTNFDYVLTVKVILGNQETTISQKRLSAVPYAKASEYSAKSDSADLAKNGIPPGTILPFAGTTAPEGFLICDGAAFDKNDARYTKLFEAIGTTWGGAGNDFNVPDLRGVFLRGVAGASDRDPDKLERVSFNGSADGNSVGSYQTDTNKSHSHQATTNSDGRHGHSLQIEKDAQAYVKDNNTTRAVRGSDRSPDGDQNLIVNTGAHNHTITMSEEGEVEARPKNVAVLYIIKH